MLSVFIFLAGVSVDQKLVICTNSNFCGGAFGPEAVECLRVLAPANLAVLPGPCIAGCSSGVNAKLVDAETSLMCLARQEGVRYSRINSVGACVDLLTSSLGMTVSPHLTEAYQNFVDGRSLLGDGRPEAALPLLDAAASISIEPPAEGLPPTPVQQRRAWAGSRWKESFYQRSLLFNRVTDSTEARVEAVYGRPGYGVGGSKVYPGKLFGETDETGVLRGEWEEEEAGGRVRLEMDPTGLSFTGMAEMGDERYEWSGERLAPPRLAQAGDRRQRWYATVLAKRSEVQLRLSKIDEALADATASTRTCPWLVDGWEALAEAGQAADQTLTAVRALRELLYLQPAQSEGISQLTSNRRREQTFKLARLITATR